MKITPSVVLDATEYYVDHFSGKYDVDKCTILRNLQLETDDELMPSSLKKLAKPTHVLDFTNNELTSVPDLRSRGDIHTLLLSMNQISVLDGRLLPRRIRNLVLANNNVSTFEQLNGLKEAPKTLENVVLRGNQVCHLEGYREHVLRAVPSLKLLDFEIITQEERLRAQKIKASEFVPTAAATGAKRDKSSELMHLVVSKMSEERRNELKEQLSRATSLAEIARIEKLLSGGV